MSFEDFVATRLAGLLRFAVVLTQDRGLAEDVCQDVLIRAQRRWDAIGPMSAPDAYVRRMIVNEYLSWRRKWSRIVPRASSQLDRAEPDHADQHAVRDELATAIAKLPPRQRAAIVMRYFEALDDAEIAEALGCTTGTVRGYVFRALRTLRIDITEHSADSERESAAAMTTKDS